MNFQELMARMAELDKPVAEETAVEECGMDMPHSMSMPGQQDSVNMSVNMSGSGSGGIKDLLDILRNLEKDTDDEMPIMIKSLGDGLGQEESVGTDNPMAPDETYGDVADVTATGDDLHSKGHESPKVNGGGNPMAVESITSRLSNLYQEIKSR